MMHLPRSSQGHMKNDKLLDSAQVQMAWLTGTAHTLWLGLWTLPDAEDIRHIDDVLQKVLTSQNHHHFALLVQHMSDNPLPLPSIDDFLFYRALYLKHEHLLTSKVRCLVVQTQHVDQTAEIGLRIFNSLCKLPFAIHLVEGDAATKRVIEQKDSEA